MWGYSERQSGLPRAARHHCGPVWRPGPPGSAPAPSFSSESPLGRPALASRLSDTTGSASSPGPSGTCPGARPSVPSGVDGPQANTDGPTRTTIKTRVNAMNLGFMSNSPSSCRGGHTIAAAMGHCPASLLRQAPHMGLAGDPTTPPRSRVGSHPHNSTELFASTQADFWGRAGATESECSHSLAKPASLTSPTPLSRSRNGQNRRNSYATIGQEGPAQCTSAGV